jgi:virginiamycin B lyase
VTYGNATGIIKTPISRPYWIDIDSAGKLVFNEQTSNNIAVMDPKIGSLVEYSVPSRNPNWGDCTNISDCGLAQVFDFAIDGTKIWFTEWVENNIGVVDTSVALPMSVELSSDKISMKAGETKTLNFSILPQSGKDISEVSLVIADTGDFLDVVTDSPKTFDLNPDSPKTIKASISATDDVSPGTYRVLLGAQTDDVSVSKFVTLTIEP